MATNVSIILQMSDGTFSYLRNDVTLNSLTEVKTDNSGILNIAGDLSAGQALQSKVVVAAAAKVVTDDATTGCFGHAAFYDAQGSIMCVIQGGGNTDSGLPMLMKPVRLSTGVTVKVLAQAGETATLKIGSLAVYCASGKSDIFFGTGSDGSAVSMLNKDGNSIGESLTGQRAVSVYATYPTTNGLAQIGVADGIGAFYIESAAGQLKFMANPALGRDSQGLVPFQPCNFSINQNDTLSLTANT